MQKLCKVCATKFSAIFRVSPRAHKKEISHFSAEVPRNVGIASKRGFCYHGDEIKHKTMKNHFFLLTVLLLFAISQSAFAVNAPLLGNIPSSVDGDTYILTVYAQDGATVSVVGGIAMLEPVTDGEGNDERDGVVRIEVPLVRNTMNEFAVTAELNGETSQAVTARIKEVSTPVAGTHPIPNPPVLNPIPEFVDTAEYIITGTAQANTNIYARTPAGEVVGSGQSGTTGKFQVKVSLKLEVTNRVNVSAENEDGVEGKATQAVIRQTVHWQGGAAEEKPALTTSGQIFFGDVQGHWAEAYINRLYEDHVVSGKSEGVFDPNGLITRAELTKIAILAFGHSISSKVSAHPFQDVPLNSWYAPYVDEAKRIGFVSGYDTGGFGPNDFVTRAAALKILLAAAGIDPAGMTSDFPDVASDAWLAPFVGFAHKNGIVSGYADGRFGPADPMTRAQVAKVVIKLLEYLEAQSS